MIFALKALWTFLDLIFLFTYWIFKENLSNLSYEVCDGQMVFKFQLFEGIQYSGGGEVFVCLPSIFCIISVTRLNLWDVKRVSFKILFVPVYFQPRFGKINLYDSLALLANNGRALRRAKHQYLELMQFQDKANQVSVMLNLVDLSLIKLLIIMQFFPGKDQEENREFKIYWK